MTTTSLSVSSHLPSRTDETHRTRLSSLHPTEQAIDSITKLIGETAHDLRAPLSTIREAVRLVHDGQLGAISSDQRECLSAAINQCNCVGQLVDEMVQSRHEAAGSVRPHLDWIDIDHVRQQVVETLQPWVLPRAIHLLWDGPFGRQTKVYADAVMLRRLIVNLVGNAIRATREGQPILIRAVADPKRGRMTWAVVDQGQGIDAADLERIALGHAPQSSRGGLGLVICRHLAGAHFSNLWIESREGTGTAASFHTTMGGPINVARNWATWRSGLFVNPESASVEEAHQLHNVLSPRKRYSIAPPRRVRVDVPSQRVELRARQTMPDFEDRLYIASVSLGATLPAESVEAFDRLIQRSLTPMEFTYRTGDRNWLILWDADRKAANLKRSQLDAEIRQHLDSIRMNWSMMSEYQFDPAGGAASARFLGDLLARRALTNAQGTTELQPTGSPIVTEEARSRAEQRLQRECSRLGNLR
ncbi:MAG: HAMP domain-containing sensor histidine kinase [Planctomycetota bacterium]